MRTTIELKGLEVHGFHGVLAHEQRDGQRFVVDLELEPLHQHASVSDDIADAVDYRIPVAIVEEMFRERRLQLLETVAAQLADELLTRLPLRRVVVRVAKPDVELTLPSEGSAVVVERLLAE
ncbi:MAG: dihydroneopterin aldolase [Gaiella sp.]